MRTPNFLKAMLATGVAAACTCGLAACAVTGGSNAVAATVNGTEIPESQITAQLENTRTQLGYEDEEAWANFLITNSLTPESLREQVINSFADQELMKAGAADLGVSVEESEVDTYVESMKANYDSDEAWKDALEQAGYTEEDYRSTIETSLLQQQLLQYFEDNADVSDDDILESAQAAAPSYDGLKRASHILFKVEDTSDKDAMAKAKEKAEDVLEKLKNDEISFEDAAKEYSDDTSAENGGDVGWNTGSFVAEFSEALEALDEGEISDVVESQYGYHIIKATDVYEAPEKVKSLKDLPEDFQDSVKNMAKSNKAYADMQDWVDKLHEKADIVINPIPADVPYNVDLTKYQEGDESSDEAAEGEDGEEAASDEAAEADADADADADAEDAEAGDEASDEAADDEAAEGEEAASSEASASSESAQS